MENYYYDVAVEDGSTDKGLRAATYARPLPRNPRAFSTIKVGDVLPALSQGPITRTQIVKYAGASYDFNPIHHDAEFASRALPGGIIAHGMMVMGYLGKCATQYLGTGLFDRFVSRNVAMTRPGDVLTIEGRVERLAPLEVGGGVVHISMTATNAISNQLVCTGEIACTLR